MKTRGSEQTVLDRAGRHTRLPRMRLHDLAERLVLEDLRLTRAVCELRLVAKAAKRHCGERRLDSVDGSGEHAPHVVGPAQVDFERVARA